MDTDTYLSVRVTTQARVDSKRLYLEDIARRGAPSDAPNIIFILYDDMGFGDIGAGAIDTSAINTPNIDALAAKGCDAK